MSEEALDQIGQGNDRGNAIPVAINSGATYDFTDVQRERMLRNERQAISLIKPAPSIDILEWDQEWAYHESYRIGFKTYGTLPPTRG